MAFEIDYILLDIGNSSFDVLYKDKTYKFDRVEDIRKFLASIDFKRSYVSSVNSRFFKGINDLLKEIIDLDSIDKKTRVEELGYKIPNLPLLASDLLFDILGCEKDSLLVDYGTASKFLLIDSNLEYKGGIIGPGLKMMNASLAGTDLLDNYEIEVPQNLINQDTKNAINASSTYLEAFKIISLFNYLKKDYPSLKLIITGGDAKTISEVFTKIGYNNYRVVENVVFKGMKKYFLLD